MLMNEEESMKSKFGTLPLCMWTLLMDGTFMDSTGSTLRGLLDLGKPHALLAIIFFFSFILVTAMTVMNMLIGVLCEVVSAVAAGEREDSAIRLMKNSILLMLKTFDEDGNGGISRQELRKVMKDPQAVAVLEQLEVDVAYLEQLQNMIYQKPGAEVSIEQIIELMLRCRGNLPTTVKHMVLGQDYTRWALTTKLNHHHQQMEHRIHGMVMMLIEEISLIKGLAVTMQQEMSLVKELTRTSVQALPQPEGHSAALPSTAPSWQL
eukprot:gnl/TRDRNA2_/TRDRNA2_173818_c4_seq12.p1 gnl/TRDRNA2_/TRDRNA2_173818_c4~~gnl/TRDRNA2_/TRDRNA2_173818_c4_seq12.p1  ORF type:complete len:264 (+),score=46.06 gnl/TRDRNA2_/TRDRNA2_173818_c4_seq12:32-823(+)